jgi:hypothetical protein
LAPRPLRITAGDYFFATEPLLSLSLCNILSDDRMGLSLINMLGFLSSVKSEGREYIKKGRIGAKIFLIHPHV